MNPVLKFNGTWRTYQQRILDNLSTHLADQKLHVVAAPGAGKTTLGLEIIARLNKPTLILAPTITIRDQWKQRLIDSFLAGKPAQDFVSTQIRAPKWITIITYQALLAAFCGKEISEAETEEPLEEEETTNEKTFSRLNPQKAAEVITLLKQASISILCFDEAHHLRNEWWKALSYLMEHLEPKQTVSLTATPPYDVDFAEWQRYSDLCGPIDELISIPELVQNGDLCPHQDFIHFSQLRAHEAEQINQHEQRLQTFLDSLYQNETLIQAVATHLKTENVEVILDTPKTYLALASFLHQLNVALPLEFLAYFDLKETQIPPFHHVYQQLFLHFVLTQKNSAFIAGKEEFFEDLSKQARQAGVLVHNSILLADSPKIRRTIANSLGKLDSIQEIVSHEAGALGKDLRLVILADYIKYDVTDCSALGVIPIWQTLKDRTDISLGVLTGSIVLLPTILKETLCTQLSQNNLSDKIRMVPFERDEKFLKITTKDTTRSVLVKWITHLFNDGKLTVLVGTQALLGEGWDAPSINALILSSTVSSYMLSNQMRGRAIRKDKNNPDKVSNIYHLASVKVLSKWEQFRQSLPSGTSTPQEEEPPIQLFDYAQLAQRFEGYEAPGQAAPHIIENGMERILPESFKNSLALAAVKPITEKLFTGLNPVMLSWAADRARTRRLWEEGFEKRYNNAELSLRKGIEHKGKMHAFSYKGYFSMFCFWAFTFGLCAAPGRSRQAVVWWLMCLAGFLIVMARPTYRYLRCSSPEKVIRQIGIVVLETLAAMGQIKTNLKRINIRCEECRLDKSVFFSIGNVSPEENNLVIKCVREVLDPIQNPRYLLVRKEFFGLWNTKDYHAMPSVIGLKKEHAQIFYNLWKKYIGDCELIYTRSAEGRKKLLYARTHAFSALFHNDSRTKPLSRYE